MVEVALDSPLFISYTSLCVAPRSLSGANPITLSNPYFGCTVAGWPRSLRNWVEARGAMLWFVCPFLFFLVV